MAKSCMRGSGSGISMGARRTLGLSVDCMSLRRGWERSASEWWVGVIGIVCSLAAGWMQECISKRGVSFGSPARQSNCDVLVDGGDMR